MNKKIILTFALVFILTLVGCSEGSSNQKNENMQTQGNTKQQEESKKILDWKIYL